MCQARNVPIPGGNPAFNLDCVNGSKKNPPFQSFYGKLKLTLALPREGKKIL